VPPRGTESTDGIDWITQKLQFLPTYVPSGRRPVYGGCQRLPAWLHKLVLSVVNLEIYDNAEIGNISRLDFFRGNSFIPLNHGHSEITGQQNLYAVRLILPELVGTRGALATITS
jgi:hypothetical protein